MGLASSLGWLRCALPVLAALSLGAACEASPPAQPAKAGSSADQSANTALQGDAQKSSRAKAESGGGGSQEPQGASRSGRAAAAAAGGAGKEPPYIGDVPAHAASSGSRPCGSSEFSVGPCGGRSAQAAGGAGAAGTAASAGADAGVDQALSGQSNQASQPDTSGCRVISVPDSVRDSYQLDTFYKKYASADGIPVVASDKPVDRTLHLACQLVKEMLSRRTDVHDALIAGKATFAIVATSERTTEIPEYRHLSKDYDTSARGLGGHTGLCAEESILCDVQNDAWRGESICVHEYAHTIAIYGLFAVDSSFENRLADAFHHAGQAGLWRDTFAAEDAQEYWAEGVQDWYYSNLEADPPDGVHGPINTKDELQRYDPMLYDLIGELLPEQTTWSDCYKQTR